jgi:hypothetical protein
MHLGRVLEMAESSPDQQAYEAKIAERFGTERQLELALPRPQPEPQSEVPATVEFSQTLRRL